MENHDRSTRFTRREAIRLLGGAAGLGMVGGCSFEPSDPGVAGIPRDAIIRTVLGDISPDAIDGVTLFHEHLSIRMSADRPSATDDVDNIVREIRVAASEGVGCIVDGGHPDLGRDLDAVRRVANETDVHVVACTGYYMESFHQPEVATSSEDQIAEGLVADAWGTGQDWWARYHETMREANNNMDARFGSISSREVGLLDGFFVQTAKQYLQNQWRTQL